MGIFPIYIPNGNLKKFPVYVCMYVLLLLLLLLLLLSLLL